MLVANSLNKPPTIPQRFDDEQVFRHYLLNKPLPELIIKIIGIHKIQTKYSSRASIQNALKQVMSTLMEKTSVLKIIK
jgi:hypothetical protein